MRASDDALPRPKPTTRRGFLRLAAAAGGGLVAATGLMAACAPPPPAQPAAPTVPPAKPAATAAPAAAPTVAAKPPAAPTAAPAAKPAAQPAAATKSDEEVDVVPLVHADGLDAVTLDPHTAPDVAYSHNLQRASAEGLLEYVVKPDGTVDVAPLLAKSWTADELRVFTFQLNEGVKFHDGTPFNAAAVKFNFERIRDLNLVPAGRLPRMSSIEAPGEYTVRFVLEAPSVEFLYPVTQMLMISPKGIQDHLADDNGRKWADENIIGTGPYVIESRQKGTETAFKKHPDYWRGWSGPHLERILVRVVPEPTTRKLMLERGEAHLAQSVPFTEIDSLSRTPGVVVESLQAPGALIHIMRFRGPLRDPNVRKAIHYAFDYDGFVQAAFQRRAALAQGPLYTQHPLHDNTVPASRQDIALARDFLSKSEFPNGGFDLSLLILPTFFSFHNAQALILQDSLKELNINLNIMPMADIATFYASVDDEARGADMWAWHATTQTPDYNFQGRRIYHTQYKRPAGVNGGYSNPRVDALLEEDQRTADLTRRRALWSEIQKTIAEDQPAMFIAIPFQFLTRRDELQGVPLNPFNFVPNYYNAWLRKRR